jgi:alpha-soluble NSF attachment protein
MSDDPQKLIEQANKKKQSAGGGGFLGMFGNSHSKLEDASELYERAANGFKINKQWQEGGQAFLQAAECHLKLEAPHEAAQKYIDAATCFKKVSGGAGVEEYVRCMELGVRRYLDMGRFAIAAKHVLSLAELFETQVVDLERAIKYYEQAADHYDGEDAASGRNKALLKVALLSAQLERYDRAFEIYEEVATKMVDNSLLKWSAKEYFFKAGLCRLCSGDIVAAKRAIEGYEQVYPGFRDQREQKLLLNILHAIEEEAVDQYTKAVADFDAVSTLDAWTTTILLRIKKHHFDSSELR